MIVKRDVLVPVQGGADLAADLFLPDDRGPHPALVTFTPYRKDDLQGVSREAAITFFVEHGYAHLLADFRGLGSSSGIAAEAMSPNEGRDAAALVEWAASQPWCDGNVGMWGISYGGITAFEAAAAQPPHLRAIIPIYAGFDIYNDWFYPGGCFNCLGVGGWASLMLAMQLGPPMFHDADGRWYDVWRERLAHSEPYFVPWLDHPARDAFWQDRAVDLERIEVPTFLIGGWRDLYPDAMPRAFERIRAERKLWMGPWLHTPPDSSSTAPVQYLPEMCRWFDRFVRDRSNGVENTPPVTIFVQGDDAGWRHEAEWPIARTERRTLFLTATGELAAEPGSDEHLFLYEADPTVGVQAGLWDPWATGLGFPEDQRPDDERSLCFTTAPLTEALEVTGSAEAHLRVAVEHGEDANFVVKLCDVRADGFSTLITTGWLRGSHRESHENPEPLRAGESIDLRIPLWATAYRVAAGHRLRLTIACSDFPRVWPTPTNPRLRVATGGSHNAALHLPVVPDGGVEGPTPVTVDPAANRSPLVHEFAPSWNIERDPVSGAMSVVFGDRRVVTTRGRDGKFAFDHTVRAAVAVDEPHGAVLEGSATFELEMPSGGRAVIVTESRYSLDGFYLSGTVDLDGVRFFEKTWRSRASPRSEEAE
jgi:putative CocE/NonD family hydrolase